MINAIKAMRLDMLMGKQYAKTFLICIVFGVAFTVVTKIFLAGIMFSMLLAATACCYPFAAQESCGGERLYGMLPMRRGQAVAGRYLYSLIIGAGTIILCTAASAAVYCAAGWELNAEEIGIGMALSFLMFVISISFQLPGYYKLGSTKGRVFTFVPMAIYFAGFSFINKTGIYRVQRVLERLGIIGILAIAAAFAALLISISAAASVKIYMKKAG